MEVGSKVKMRLKYGGFEAVFAFFTGSLSAVSVDAIFNVRIGVWKSILVGGVVGGLEALKELAEELKDYYKEKGERVELNHDRL